MKDIPESFELLNGKSLFMELVGAFNLNEGEIGVSVRLLVEEKHCNSTGAIYAGLFSAMADISLGNNIACASLADDQFRRENGLAQKTKSE